MNHHKNSKGGGPGLLIAAAFIGPGTVTVCTLAGANHQYGLLWVMVIAILVTIFLQELAARLGIISRLDLASLIRQQITSPLMRVTLISLVFCAIVVGNAAYEAGNISGAILGLNSLGEFPYAPAVLGAIAAVILWSGNYKIIERVLISLVAIMSLSFIITAILTKPNIGELAKGLIPSLEADPLLMLGLVGTTIVPYNLFLHAALAKNKWTSEEVSHSRRDTIRSIAIGGIVSLAIIISAAGINPEASISSARDLAQSLEPTYGSIAKYLLSIGMFAAAITSAVTAPLAAAFVAQGCFRWSDAINTWKFRSVWASIILAGVTFSSLGFKPIEIIKFAQVTNGLLLPIIAGLLLWLGAKSSLLGKHANSLSKTVIGALITLLALALGAKTIWTVFS